MNDKYGNRIKEYIEEIEILKKERQNIEKKL